MSTKEFEQLNTKDLPKVNDALKAKGQQPIAYVPESSTAEGILARYFDHDAAESMATETD